MTDIRPSSPQSPHSPRANGADAASGDDPSHGLRAMGAHAHQLQAALRAADLYNNRGGSEDTDTASWLISSALDLAQECVVDIDSLARTLKDRGAATALLQTVADLRVRAHQLLAATRAADHFLEQDTREDRETGAWLIATALRLALKMSAAFDDSVLAQRRPAAEKADIDPHDAATSRRVAAAATPLRGAA